MPKRKRVEMSAAEQRLATQPASRSSRKRVASDVIGFAKQPVQSEPVHKAPSRSPLVKAQISENVAIEGSEVKEGTPEANIKSEKADEQQENIASPTPTKKRRKQPDKKDKADENSTVKEEPQPKTSRKRKTKEEKEAEAMPLAPRTIGHKLFIGAHVSSAGGVPNSILNSVHIGANGFALFLKSQRKWANPPLADEQSVSFHDNCSKHSYDQAKHVVPHGSYLVNLAHVDKARTEQAYSSFLDDLQRCERLGIGLYNFHPGVANSVGDDRPAAISHLARNINRAHGETSTVVTLLENMAAGGNVLGSTFEDLRDIIALIDDKSRVGVCLDTCHAFAGGYDLRSPTAFADTMEQFETIVGIKYLRAVHMNDSKAPLASHRDLHANIGTGYLGLRAFHNLVNDTRFVGLPLILETPIEVKDENGTPVKDEKGKQKEDKAIWATEIKLLESLVDMDVESKVFIKLEADLARKGEPERRRLAEQVERKLQKKDSKRQRAPKSKAGKKKLKEENGDSDDSDLSSVASF